MTPFLKHYHCNEPYMSSSSVANLNMNAILNPNTANASLAPDTIEQIHLVLPCS